VALAVMVFYFALGFLWGYIWTKTSYQRDLEERYKKLQQKNQALQQDKETTDLTVLAEKLIREGKLDEAMRWINQALATNPNDGRAMMTKGRILKRQAMDAGPQSDERKTLLDQALACATRAIDLMPPENRAEPTYNKACYQALLGFDKKEVLATLQAAFKMHPQLREGAGTDDDLETLWNDAEFKRLTDETPPQGS
jgi:tetratricopeptide (TPR) repeat protein